MKRINKKALKDTDNEISNLEGRIDEREGQIKKLRKKISKAQKEIQELIEVTGLSTIDELKKILDQQQKLEKRNRELISGLKARFNKSEIPIEERMKYWENEIAKLEEYAEAALRVEYSTQEEEELEDEIETLDGEIAQLEDELGEYRTQFEDFAKDANRILAPEESFPGETIEDMKLIQEKLDNFINKVEGRKNNAIMAIKIFEQIEAEEEEKIKDLFGADDLASKYFREITNGAYESVEYNPERGTLLVKTPEGVALEAWQLSTGTYDQLYFATRLSLAHQILGGKKGFLLLDDPFLAADSTRLANQLDMLVDQVKDGWQIFYFSVKDEVVDYLRSEHSGEEFDYIELQEIS